MPGTGTTQVLECHRRLFAEFSDEFQREIRRITGLDVRDSAAEIETATGTIVHAFACDTMVLVLVLAQNVSADDCSRTGPGDHP